MENNNKIRLSKSVVGAKEAQAVQDVIINDGYLGMGKKVEEFEKNLREYLGNDREVICVNSGTAALQLSLLSLGLKIGDEVLVQSLTYVASFQAISAVGLKPVACEVYPETCTIDLQDAEKKLTEKTKVIMPVHYASRTGDLEAIYEFAKKHNLRVVEDAAHAFGSLYSGEKIGSFGDVVCFSFDGIKNITSGEGGAIITNDQKVIKFAKDARLLGVQKDTEKRYAGQRSWEFDVMHQGYRFHMSNLFAAIGIVQLERFEKEFKPKRQELAKKYYVALSNINEIELFANDFDTIVPHIFPIKIANNKRDVLRKYLIDNNIECGIHYMPNHFLTFYGARKGDLPVTEKLYTQILSLPLHPDLTKNQQNLIINKIKEFFN